MSQEYGGPPRTSPTSTSNRVNHAGYRNFTWNTKKKKKRHVNELHKTKRVALFGIFSGSASRATYAVSGERNWASYRVTCTRLLGGSTVCKNREQTWLEGFKTGRHRGIQRFYCHGLVSKTWSGRWPEPDAASLVTWNISMLIPSIGTGVKQQGKGCWSSSSAVATI